MNLTPALLRSLIREMAAPTALHTQSLREGDQISGRFEEATTGRTVSLTCNILSDSAVDEPTPLAASNLSLSDRDLYITPGVSDLIANQEYADPNELVVLATADLVDLDPPADFYSDDPSPGEMWNEVKIALLARELVRYKR